MSKLPRFHRLRADDGLGPLTEGAVPDGVNAELECVAWLQVPGQRMAVKAEVWTETEGGGSQRAGKKWKAAAPADDASGV